MVFLSAFPLQATLLPYTYTVPIQLKFNSEPRKIFGMAPCLNYNAHGGWTVFCNFLSGSKICKRLFQWKINLFQEACFQFRCLGNIVKKTLDLFSFMQRETERRKEREGEERRKRRRRSRERERESKNKWTNRNFYNIQTFIRNRKYPGYLTVILPWTYLVGLRLSGELSVGNSYKSPQGPKEIK